MEQFDKAVADGLLGISSFDLDLASKAGRERVILAMDHLGLAFFESDLKDNRAVFSANAYTMFGFDPPPPGTPAKRHQFWDCYHPDDKKWAAETYNLDLMGRRGSDTYKERVRIIRKNDGAVRWIEWFGRMFGPPGARTHTVGMLRDVTEEEEARVRDLESQHRTLTLMREVDHRANNALSNVLALIQLTKADTIEEYKRRLHARIRAMSRTQSLLFRNSFESVAMREVILSEMSAYVGHFMVSGLEPTLKAIAAQPIAMALHELVTNSAKYGALSRSNGSVEIEVSEDDGYIVLNWCEETSQGETSSKGTGKQLIQQQARTMRGAVIWTWEHNHLHVQFSFPADQWCIPASANINNKS